MVRMVGRVWVVTSLFAGGGHVSEALSAPAARIVSTVDRKALLKERRECEARLEAIDTELRSAQREAQEASSSSLAQERRARGEQAPAFHDSYMETRDFGYLSKSAGVYTTTSTKFGSGGPPQSAFAIAPRNFLREVEELWRFALNKPKRKQESTRTNDPAIQNARNTIKSLTLSNDAVWQREAARVQVDAPLVLKVPYYLLCFVLDTLFDGRPIARFWFLETVARMPYFSYISMLHLYESLGWWRRSAEAKKVHFAEEWNEFHHLLIMESLGGDERWPDRFFAHHAAIVYYWVLVALWILSPNLAYEFSELIEAHAVDTYTQFCDENREKLASLSAPQIAIDYYEADSLFPTFQTVDRRARPSVETLLDVFENIRDDEQAHVNTMQACGDPDVAKRATETEFVTFLIITLISLPLAIFLVEDELCLITYCVDPNSIVQQLNGMLNINSIIVS